MKKKTKKQPIMTLTTKDWNKTPKRDQDRALLFMHKVLVELSEHRKYGYSPDFWAAFP